MLVNKARKEGRAEGLAEGKRDTLTRLNGWREKCVKAIAEGEDPPELPEWAREGMDDHDEDKEGA